MYIPNQKTQLILEDGTMFGGRSFGCSASISGEVVFNTGMVGYPESLTDPSYKGQILVLTYPLIGNYGVSGYPRSGSLDGGFESESLKVSGLVVSEISRDHNHWNAVRSLDSWLAEEHVPGIFGMDTRALTKHLRDRGSMLGKIVIDHQPVDLHNPNLENLVAQVSLPKPLLYRGSGKRLVVIDCGCKLSIIRNLVARGLTILRVPWDYDFFDESFDGIVISNGPGDPKMCARTVSHVRRALEEERPVFGICLGHQILALAAGAETYKMKFGHRGQNQPCVQAGTNRCYITSQNHGYAVEPQTLPSGWVPWFINANDGSNEGIRHVSRPWMSVQFHPEAAPGPVDAGFLFDEFLALL